MPTLSRKRSRTSVYRDDKQTAEKRAAENEKSRVRMAARRSGETEEQRDIRLAANREEVARHRRKIPEGRYKGRQFEKVFILFILIFL